MPGGKPFHKVCHFSSVHSVWDTRVFYRECVSLSKHYHVTLIAVGDGQLETYMRNGVKVIKVARPASFVYRFLKTIFQVFILAVKEDADLYHIHDAEMVPFGIALRLLGKPVIYDIHENTHDDILLKPWLPLSVRRVIAGTYNLMLAVASRFLHFIVVTASPDFLPRFFARPGQSSIVQNFADPKQFEPFRVEKRSSLSGNQFFYVGMIRDMYYNIDPVLEALYLLSKQGIETTLHLIGYFGVDTEKGFQQLPYWNEIKHHVKLHGFLEMPDAYAISRECKIGICIKNQPEHMLVSHERKWFEYIAAGLPSIFSDTPIYNNINSEKQVGLAVDLTSPLSIADALKQLLIDHALLDRLTDNCTEVADQTVNWNKEFAILNATYEKLLQ